MEFSEVIEKRRSVRKYTDAPVPEAVMRRALQDALLAPNSSNLQPWQFFWVRTPEKKDALAKACLSQNAARTAAEIVVAVARIDRWREHAQILLDQAGGKDAHSAMKQYYQKLVPLMYSHGWLNILGWIKRVTLWGIGFKRPIPRGPTTREGVFEVVVKSTALACENFMLSITNQGYGTCPMEGFDEIRVKKLLGLGRESRVVMCISVGAPAPDGIYGPRIRLEESRMIAEI